MVEHWSPRRDKAHSYRPSRRDWWASRRVGSGSQRSRISGTTIGVVLAAAACAGISFGLGARDDEFAIASTPAGLIEFGICHSGGGTNCVVDGDTIWLNGENIRLADIDTPETHEAKCASEQALGDQATQRLQALLNSGPVHVSSIDRDTDRYGRKLRIVAVGGVSVGETLVGEGLARWYAGRRRSWCG